MNREQGFSWRFIWYRINKFISSNIAEEKNEWSDETLGLPDEVNGVDGHEDSKYVAYEMHDHDTDEDEGEVVLRDLLSAQLE